MSSASSSSDEPPGVVVWDIETTSLDTKKGDVVQFAFMQLNPYTWDVEKQRSVYIYSSNLTQDSTEIHGITPERLSQPDVVKFVDAAPWIRRWLDGRIWVGHNIINYDIPLLEEQFRREGCGEFPRPAGVIDSLRFARKVVPRDKVRNYKLGTLANTFHLTEHQLHNALDDCAATRQTMMLVALHSALAKYACGGIWHTGGYDR